MRKKLLFETKESMLEQKDSLVEEYLRNGGVITVFKPQTEKTWDDDPIPDKKDENED